MKIRNAITQVYGTVQGEGLYIGTPQIFVRLYGCSIGCMYCDTPDSAFDPAVAMVELEPGSDRFSAYPNPMPAETLLRVCNTIAAELPVEIISITGGEPLESSDYLYEISSYIKANSSYKILLETGGLHPGPLEKVIDMIDIISMDIKLPSASGLPNPLPAHARFIEVVKKYHALHKLYIKIIINNLSSQEEIDRILAVIPDGVTLVLQPQTEPDGKVDVNVFKTTFNLYKYMLKSCRKILLIPQIHKFLDLK